LKHPAAELVDVGVTNNGYRPGGVDTAMQAWIRSQPADEIGASLHGSFLGLLRPGNPDHPEHSARSPITRLTDDDNGKVWSVDDA
jgi:hypothetical protein